MRKIFIIIFFIILLTFSVSASSWDSTSDGFTYDLYPYLNQTYVDISNIPSGGRFGLTVSPDSNLPNTFDYVDILFESDTSNPRFATNITWLTVKNLYGNVYRAYGPLQSNYVYDSSVWVYPTGGTFFNVLSFKVSSVNYQLHDISLGYQFSIPGNTSSSGQISSYPFSLNSAAVATSDVYADLILNFSWVEYDRVEVHFSSLFGCNVLAHVDGIDVLDDIVTNQVEPNGGETIVTLDFSKLDRSINSNTCHIYIRSYVLPFAGSVRVFQLKNAVGFVRSSGSNFWPFWLQRIIDSIKSLNPNTSVGSDFEDSVATQVTEMDSLNEQLQEVTKPSIDDIESSVDDYISESDVSDSTGPLLEIFNSDIFISVIMMSLILALGSYVLYGKR